eukprot:768797-Hanusia_phi.AAC.9
MKPSRLRQTLHRLQRQLKILNGEHPSTQEDVQEETQEGVWDLSELLLDKDKVALRLAIDRSVTSLQLGPPRSETELIERQILEITRHLERLRRRSPDAIDLFRRCQSDMGYSLHHDGSYESVASQSKSSSYTALRKLKL